MLIIFDMELIVQLSFNFLEPWVEWIANEFSSVRYGGFSQLIRVFRYGCKGSIQLPETKYLRLYLDRDFYEWSRSTFFVLHIDFDCVPDFDNLSQVGACCGQRHCNFLVWHALSPLIAICLWFWNFTVDFLAIGCVALGTLFNHLQDLFFLCKDFIPIAFHLKMPEQLYFVF